MPSEHVSLKYEMSVRLACLHFDIWKVETFPFVIALSGLDPNTNFVDAIPAYFRAAGDLLALLTAPAVMKNYNRLLAAELRGYTVGDYLKQMHNNSANPLFLPE